MVIKTANSHLISSCRPNPFVFRTLVKSSFFIDFAFAENKPVALIGAPNRCKLTVAGPQQMDAAVTERLGQLGADVQLDPSAWLAGQFAHKSSAVNAMTQTTVIVRM